MNAALFQPTSKGSIHVYLKDLTATIPEEPYDIWNGSRFLFAKDLFPDKLSDLGGKVLRATTFQNFPTTYQVKTMIIDFEDKHVGKLQQKKLLRRVLIGASWAFFLSVKYSRTSVSNSSNDNDF